MQQTLQHLIGAQPVIFCRTPEEFAQHETGFTMQDHAAVVPGCPGVIRTRLNFSAPTSMTQVKKQGLQSLNSFHALK
jgi:hypothetical protein